MRIDIYSVPPWEIDTAHPKPGVYVDRVDEPDSDPVGPFRSISTAHLAAIEMMDGRQVGCA